MYSNPQWGPGAGPARGRNPLGLVSGSLGEASKHKVDEMGHIVLPEEAQLQVETPLRSLNVTPLPLCVGGA